MKLLQTLIRWLGNLLLATAVLLAATVWLPKAFHMKAYVVTSSSMEPAITAGSVVYISEYGEDEPVCPGDIISFHAGGVMVTHRVVSVDDSLGTAVTRGDANQVQDLSPVPFGSVEGKVRFHIPGIGYLLLH